ncbi:MAG: YwaF family protein [Clostridia bacterium]|nr:YwaF family protein [Clostridia bacterium]
MFSTEHLIWLGISAGVIAAFLLLFFLTRWKTDTCIAVALVVLWLCEAVMISYRVSFHQNADDPWKGFFLDAEMLPLHLCTVQLVFLLIAKLSKKVSPVRRALYPVIAIGGTAGALAAMLVPVEGVAFVAETYAQTAPSYRYFIYHSVLFAISVRVAADKDMEWSGVSYLHTLVFFAMMLFFSIFVNAILHTNFFYTAYPPMENLPFFSVVEGDIGSWYLYLLKLALVALIVITLFYIPFWIARAVQRRKERPVRRIRVELPEEDEAAPFTISSILGSGEEE